MLQENNNFPRTPCQSLTDPQGSADHSLENAAIQDGLTTLGLSILQKKIKTNHTYFCHSSVWVQCKIFFFYFKRYSRAPSKPLKTSLHFLCKIVAKLHAKNSINNQINSVILTLLIWLFMEFRS